jgi:hypothetical protein
MQDTLQNPELPTGKPKASAAMIATTAVVAIVVLGIFWFVFEPFQRGRLRSSSRSVRVQMSSDETDYRKKIEVGDLALSRAENFIHQEVTILNGDVSNAGTQPVAGLGLTMEFFDDMNQVVLRETRGILRSPGPVLAPGERRAFEISFDHVPNSWNMQMPVVRVEYLKLSTAK